MAKTPKGTAAPEAAAKNRAKWDFVAESGRVTYTLGKLTRSAIIPWMAQIPEDLRVVSFWGIRQKAGDESAMDAGTPDAVRFGAVVDKLLDICAGNFADDRGAPTLAEIYEAMVQQKQAKNPADAEQIWAKQSKEKREAWIKSDAIAKRLKSIKADKQAQRAKAALADVDPDDVPEFE